MAMSREAHFSFFYAPVRGDGGEVLGVFCACTEITQQVFAKRERAAELDRLREMFAASPSFVAVLRGPDHRFELTSLKSGFSILSTSLCATAMGGLMASSSKVWM